jgi:fatty acid desaturase
MSVTNPTQMEATRRARQTLSCGLETEIAELRRLRPVRRLAEIGFFAALWAAGIAVGLIALDATGPMEWLLRLGGILGAAAALNAFYLLSHEGHHHLLFRSPLANDTANLALCVPLLHAPSAYRVLHELHHRYLGGPGDPDEYRNYTDNARVRWALQWVRLTMGTLVYMPLIPVVAWRRAERADRARIALEYTAMTAVWVPVFVVLPMRALLQVWLIPGVVVGYVSAVRALLLNENYHLEHHLFPEVPSYNLPRLRALLRPRVPHTIEAESYTRFLGGFVGRCLRGDESLLGLRRHAPLAPEVQR